MIASILCTVQRKAPQAVPAMQKSPADATSHNSHEKPILISVGADYGKVKSETRLSGQAARYHRLVTPAMNQSVDQSAALLTFNFSLITFAPTADC